MRAVLVAAGLVLGPNAIHGETTSSHTATPDPRLFIKEFRVDGAHHLARLEIEKAVYRFLGPDRTNDDVERARAALEKAYRSNGFETIAVQVPQQEVRNGVIHLKVIEQTVGRLRVVGSHYFSPDEVKADAPSMAPGVLLNFPAVQRDIVDLNQNADRRVTPSIHQGSTPDTVDVDLEVKDSLPVHGSLELNNRYSADTSELRLNGSISATNLWQRGHVAGLSYQTSPQNTREVKVFSGYYIAPAPIFDGTRLILQGTKQDSNVSTLGGVSVAAPGWSVGARLSFSLPPLTDTIRQSLSIGIDFRHADQDIDLNAGPNQPPTTIRAPTDQIPFSATYALTLDGKHSRSAFDATITFHPRGLGSGTGDFNRNRFGADGSFVVLRGGLSQTRELPAGFQVFGRADGQMSSGPLLSSNQFIAGGLDTVRGYLEAEAAGDDGVNGSIELRTPSLIAKKLGELRIYAFGDAAALWVHDVLPEQHSHFYLGSYGVGGRFRVYDHFEGSLDFGVPVMKLGRTKANESRVTFRVSTDY